MAKIYRSAQGKSVDIDMLRLRNEEEIAVGNMKVNARGDELGPGGVVVKTRNEVMDEYYSTNAVYTKESIANDKIAKREELEPDDFSDLEAGIAEQDAQMPVKPQLRGSLADAVAKSTKVEQKLLTPKKPIQRI
jgi:N-methylhydantoinase A/oxoprolinase/acetone carboxylase beta subunit